MSPEQQSDQDQSLWTYIPLNQFSAPSEPTSEAVIGGIRAAWAQIWPWYAGQSPEPEMPLQHLRTAPIDLLDRLVPAPDWQSHARQALDQTLQSWLHSHVDNSRNQFVIAAPSSGGAETISEWAQEQDLQIIHPPTVQQILDQDTAWLEQWTCAGNGRFVLPMLERTFLRHHRGLFLVRRLLEELSHPAYSCLIGCQSWAWTFLQKICPIGLSNMQTWTLAPLDGQRLATWITGELAATDLAHNVTFRHTDNGKLAIDLHEGNGFAGDSTNLFEQIAARSRGNPGLAWSIWRHSLSVAADIDVNQEAQAEAEQDDKRTVWVRSWDTLNLPTVPTELSTDGLLILHALLVHDGLPEDLIYALIPGHTPALSRMLAHLAQLGLVNLSGEGLWRISDIAYPSVRQRLRRDGYLVDSL